MKKSFLTQIFNIPFKEYFFVCFGLNLLIIILLFLLQNNLPPVVPLFYGLPTGDEQLVPRMFLAIPCLSAIIIIVINGVVAKLSKSAFIQRVLVGLILAGTLLALITTIKIFFLVASF